jgi:hypothetical protein
MRKSEIEYTNRILINAVFFQVVFGCWLEDPQIRQWMQNHGIPNGRELQSISDSL